MKKFLFVIGAIVFGFAVQAQGNFDEVAKVNTDKHDFGKIPQGVPVDFYFEITNKSDKPIVIEYAQASCGCTTPEVPKEPIAPGTTARLKVTYNAAAMGAFTKPVTIKLAGVDQPKVVNITGEVVAKASATEMVKDQQPVAVPPAIIKNSTSTSPVKSKMKTSKAKTTAKAGK